MKFFWLRREAEVQPRFRRSLAKAEKSSGLFALPDQSGDGSLADQNGALLLGGPKAQFVTDKFEVSNLLRARVDFIPGAVDACNELIPSSRNLPV
jgi:hypothetical protein